MASFAAAWGWDAGPKMAPEVGDLDPGGGESGRGRRLAREVSGVPRGVGVADFQIFRFSGKRTFESRVVNG